MHITVTDSDYEAKVIKSDKPVLVDFWAEWCVAPETTIYTDQLTGVPAKMISAGQQLVGWDKKMTRGTVAYSQTTAEGGHCRELKTISGRCIKLTDDHLVFTKQGWVRADNLTENDHVAVLPVRETIPFKGKNKVLVALQDIQKFASPQMQIDTYIKQLTDKGLLPLKENQPQLMILARLAGALFSDGTLYEGKHNYREISFALGRHEDVEPVVADLQALGFTKVHTRKRSSQGTIEGRTFIQSGFRVKCLSTALYLLMRALGVPTGSKLSQVVVVPQWIKTGAKTVKREFLAGILGGDGPKPAILLTERPKKQPYNHLSINNYEFHKLSSLKDNGLSFAQDLKMLLAEFGVGVKNVFTDEQEFTRKDGRKTVTVHLRFAHNFQTGYSLTHRIGYAYSQTKAEAAATVGEFIKIVLTKRAAWQKLNQRAIKLFQTGISVKQVAQKLHLTYDTVFGWTKSGKQATVAYHLLKFPQWLTQVTQGLGDGFIWEELVKVKPIYLPAVQKITVTPTHNFVANGFLVHNCGPCRMQNPILEELDKELGDKGVIAKMNVDENPTVPGKYGIMSIPTLMLFHKGQMVKQWIGVQSKETLKGEFDKIIPASPAGRQ